MRTSLFLVSGCRFIGVCRQWRRVMRGELAAALGAVERQLWSMWSNELCHSCYFKCTKTSTRDLQE